MLNISGSPEMPDIWQEIISLLEGTWFQALIEKLSGIGFWGEIAAVIFIMALTAIIISMLISVVRGCTLAFRKISANASKSKVH